jgi:hypothetical protein
MAAVRRRLGLADRRLYQQASSVPPLWCEVLTALLHTKFYDQRIHHRGVNGARIANLWVSAIIHVGWIHWPKFVQELSQRSAEIKYGIGSSLLLVGYAGGCLQLSRHFNQGQRQLASVIRPRISPNAKMLIMHDIEAPFLSALGSTLRHTVSVQSFICTKVQ